MQPRFRRAADADHPLSETGTNEMLSEMAVSLFHETVAQMLAKLGLDNKLSEKQADVYTVTIDERLQIQVFNA